MAFLDYCDSEKIPSDKFSITRSNTQSKNDLYISILNQYGQNLVDQLIQDSGVWDFKNSINHYLTTEKRPELFKNLINNI